jgi:hypothetical protein
MDPLVVQGIAGLLCLVNLFVCLLIVRSGYYSFGQKLAQCAIVWCIPLLGAIAVWAFLRTQEHSEVFDTRTYPEPSQKMVGPAIDDAIHDSFGSGGGGEGGGSD